MFRKKLQPEDFLENTLYEYLKSHPTYMLPLLRAHNFILRDLGPLNFYTRHYIGIMAAARHRCSYLINLSQKEFLHNGGDPKWLNGLKFASTKMQNLNKINIILAHQPWLFSKSHVEALTKGPSSWTLSELTQAIIIMAHFHALCSLAFGCKFGYAEPENCDEDENELEEIEIEELQMDATNGSQRIKKIVKRRPTSRMIVERCKQLEMENLADFVRFKMHDGNGIGRNKKIPHNRTVLNSHSSHPLHHPNNHHPHNHNSQQDCHSTTVSDQRTSCFDSNLETNRSIFNIIGVNHDSHEEGEEAGDGDEENDESEHDGHGIFDGGTHCDASIDTESKGYIESSTTPTTARNASLSPSLIESKMAPSSDQFGGGPASDMDESLTESETSSNISISSLINDNINSESKNKNNKKITEDSEMNNDKENNFTNNANQPKSTGTVPEKEGKVSSCTATTATTSLSHSSGSSTPVLTGNANQEQNSWSEEEWKKHNYDVLVQGAEFGYIDFASKGRPSEVSTFRIQDYQWEDQGFSLSNLLYPDIGKFLDEKFKVGYNLTYYTIGPRTNIDTSPFRRAIWNYIQCIYGARHDDYNYREVNILLERKLKTYIKCLGCYPQNSVNFDFSAVMKGFRPSEKIHVIIMVAEARMQTELLYALRTLTEFMKGR